MPTEPSFPRSLARIASHRPMNDVPRLILNMLTHPVGLLLGILTLGAWIMSVLVLENGTAPPAVPYFLALTPAGLLIHLLTAPCSIDQARVLAKVAHDDVAAGPYVRRWIAPDRTPSTVEYWLVRAYLRDQGLNQRRFTFGAHVTLRPKAHKSNKSW